MIKYRNSVPLIYVRHGESERNAFCHAENISTDCDPLLTEKGLMQAKFTADHIEEIVKKQKYGKIVVLSSPTQRAVNTMREFTDRLNSNIEVHIMNELIEYVGMHKIIPPDLEELGIKHDLNWEEFNDRVFQFYKTLKDELDTYDDNTICIIFGHGLFLSVLLSIQSSQGIIEGVPQVVIELPNCSTSSLSYNRSDKMWKIYNIGTVSHIPNNLKTGDFTLFGV